MFLFLYIIQQSSVFPWGLIFNYYGDTFLEGFGVKASISFFFKKKNWGSIVALQCVLVSAVQQSESALHIHISPVSWISFPFRSPESVE